MNDVLHPIDPFTGHRDPPVPITSNAEIGALCRQLRAAQGAWQALGLEGRIAALEALSRVLAGQSGELRQALSHDTGRERIAAVEIGALQGIIALAVRNARELFAGPALHDWQAASQPGIAGRQQLLPYPLVGVIAPWNFPLLLSMVDTSPALLAGAAVLIKPSEVTPRHVEPLRRLVRSIEPLAGVIGWAQGAGPTGAAVIDQVDAVVCTGSVRTGRIVAEHAARRFIPAFLELGGKDAVIVTADAPLDRAARAIVRGAVAATGQACQSLERVYVARAALPALIEEMLAILPQIKLTCEDPTGHIGPFIMARQADIVREHIEDALERGATLAFGGKIIERGGRWCEPTLLTEVNHSMRVMREETFGPVIPVMAFDSLEEAIELANDSEYGLSANVFAADEPAALAIAERLHAGFISLGDVSLSSQVMDFEWEGLRYSGLGRSRMGPSGIARYLRSKAIVAQRGLPSAVTDLANR